MPGNLKNFNATVPVEQECPFPKEEPNGTLDIQEALTTAVSSAFDANERL